MVATDDPRAACLVDVLCSSLGTERRAELQSKLLGDRSGAVAAFVDGSAGTLYISTRRAHSGDLEVVSSNQPSYTGGCDSQVLFTKLQPGSLPDKNATKAFVASVVTPAAASNLLHLQSLLSLYGGVLGDAGISQERVQALTGLVQQLASGLSSAVIRSGVDGDAARSVDPDDAPLDGIMSTADEIQLWSDLAGDYRLDDDLRSRAAAVLGALEPLRGAFGASGGLKAASPEALPEALEEAAAAAEHLWSLEAPPGGARRHAYGERRLAHLLGRIGDDVAAAIRSRLRGANLWAPDDGGGADALVGALLPLASGWAGAVGRLMRDWAGPASRRRWEGAPVALPQLLALAARLEEIASLRSALLSLPKLLSPPELASLGLDANNPLQSADPLLVGPAGDPLWDAAKAELSRRMGSVEAVLADRLRGTFAQVLSVLSSSRSGASAQPLQVYDRLLRFAGLLRRPGLAQALAGEYAQAAQALRGILQAYEGEVAQRLGSAGRHGDAPASFEGASAAQVGKYLSEQVGRVVWAAQVEAKVGKAAKALALVSPPEEHARSEAPAVAALLGRAAQLRAAEAERWQRDVRARLDGIKLNKSERVLNLGADSIQISYNDELATIQRQARQLQALGLAVSADLLEDVKAAREFHRQAMVLKQIVNFYNTIGKEIIHCQKPMLIADAERFEAELRNSKEDGRLLTWRDSAGLQRYIDRLQGVARQLTEKKRRLKAAHKAVLEKVAALAQQELSASALPRWRRAVAEIRQTFADLEREFPDQKLWRRHWDHQLAKALDFQFRRELEAMAASVPQLEKTEVAVYMEESRLVFEPPLEDIRRTLNRAIRDFLNIPAAFTGVSDRSAKPGFFAHIPARHADAVAEAFVQVENVLDQLTQLQKSFLEKAPAEAGGREQKTQRDWLAVGRFEKGDAFNEWVDRAAQRWEPRDWVAHFDALRALEKETDRILLEKKVPLPPPGAEGRRPCLTVSFAPAKKKLDEKLRHVGQALASGVARLAKKDRARIDAFLDECGAFFSATQKTAEEIGQARVAARQLTERLWEMKAAAKQVADKRELLAWMGGRDPLVEEDLAERLDAALSRLQGFEGDIQKKVDSLKGEWEDKTRALFERTVALKGRWEQLRGTLGTPKTDSEDVVATLDALMKEADDRLDEAAKVTATRKLLGLDEAPFTELEHIGQRVRDTQKAWGELKEFAEGKERLNATPWLQIRNQAQYKIEDFIGEWGGRFGKDAEAGNAVALKVMSDLGAFKLLLPIVKFIVGDGWDPVTHWKDLFSILGLPRETTIDTLTLGHFASRAALVDERQEDIRKLHAEVKGEVQIRQALNELKAWSNKCEFSLKEEAAQGGEAQGSVLIREWKEVLSQVADQQSLLASLKDVPYYQKFAREAEEWEVDLAALTECLGLLNVIQRKWVYLAPIFTRGALPSKQQLFTSIDRDFRAIMARVKSEKLVVRLVKGKRGLPEDLRRMAGQLEVCQKALSEFLEEKRGLFPRFYFIGDDDLLEILGQSKNPEVIQAHLKKLFAGISTVGFSPDKRTIVSMVSAEQETVPLQQAVAVTDAVEAWLSDLAVAMRGTLQAQLGRVLASGQPGGAEVASQICGVAEQIRFCASVERALPAGQLRAVHEQLLATLRQLTAAVPEGRVAQLNNQALVMDLIHNIDVVEQLSAERVADPGAWGWFRQLRYYAGSGAAAADGRDARVRMADGDFKYTYEYQGNAPKLVHTPLTDKCYLTLTQGMALGYGGNPYGPAGTGKTESVKALGQCMARQVLVFNCDEEFDFKSMGRIFMGLVKCGAWGCFDEFNRLEEDVLSAVSQQIQTIQAALKNREPSMEFMGRRLAVDFNAGIFVTLNPAGKGYGGRSKLPDNLKQLFRSVAMSVPDNDLIAEVIMLSEGFRTAREIGRKLVSLFSLSKQLLSPQQHYDWGLRALKTVLGIAGRLLRQEAQRGRQPDAAQEAALVIRAMRVTTLPKLAFEDADRFQALISDVFPGAVVSDVSEPELEAAILKVLEKEGLEHVPAQVEKILQLHMACQQRIGVIIVGPSGSGKTTLWETLVNAYQLLRVKPVLHVMNPKAVPRQQLLGHMDLDTREWFDGILTAAARQVVREPPEQRSWIVCDGDVDPEWIESLNSVLDDNRLLTLPSGERIQFGGNVNFIFECDDLKYASPATVSRTGMLFLSEDAIDASLIVKGWVSRNGRQAVALFVEEVFYKALEWVLQNSPPAVATTKVGIVKNALSHVLAASSRQECMAGLARGFIANMAPASRGAFLDFFGQLARERDLLALPSKAFEQSSSPAAGSLVLVPDAAQAKATIMPWLQTNQPFIVVGPEGCGKALLLQNCFADLSSTVVATVACSSQTTAEHVVQKLRQMCGNPASTTSGRVLRPSTDRMVLYLKDINLPRPDKYETIQLIAFLQQLVAYNGFYDDDLEFIGLERIQIVASMNPATTVGRFPLNSRFTAIVRVVAVDCPPREQLEAVYGGMIRAAVAGMAGKAVAKQWAADDRAQALAATMLDVYEQVRQRFSVDTHRHYAFTPRCVADWVHGLRRYDVSADEFLDAVAYEGQRIFRDRLVGFAAAADFDALLAQALAKGFRHQARPEEPLFVSGGGAGGGAGGDAPAGKRGAQALQAAQLARVDAAQFAALAAEKLRLYERESRSLDIQLFREVLQRLVRFDRVLSQPGGSLLLCGRSGVGRRTSVSLAAYMQRMQVFTPKMTRAYGLKQFRADLKKVLVEVGVEGRATVLFLEDHQLVEPAFLEMVNSLLASGEVPGLFTAQEIEASLSPLRELLAEDGRFRHVFDLFTSRVRERLHVVLSMDPTGADFARRCLSNPAVFKVCSVHWLDRWGDDGMEVVPRALLGPVLGESKESLVLLRNMAVLHNSVVESVGATPREYVTLINLMAKIISRKSQSSGDQRARLTQGLGKLDEAAAKVDSLSRAAVETQGKLAVKQQEAQDALRQIQAKMQIASDRKREVQQLEAQLSSERQELDAKKADIEVELSDVQPQIDAARAAVGQIKSDNLNEIRSLSKPPDAIRDVLEAVLRLMGSEDTSWQGMKKFLGGRGVKDDILNYDAHSLQPQDRAAVMKLLATNGASFEEATIKRASVAAAPLAAWVKANIAYSQALERVAPLERQLSQLMQNLDAANAKVQECQRDLQALDLEVQKLQADFAKRTSEGERLKLDLQKANDQLAAAQTLLSKLGGEKDRWEAQVRAMDVEAQQLPLNSLMAAAFVTYLPSHAEDVRADHLRTWARILRLEAFDLKYFLSTESEMLEWKAQGLPADDLSMENTLVILNTQQAPFIIDPATQATEWLKAHLRGEKGSFDSIAMQHERFVTTLEMAVRFGKTLAIEEVDRIEPILYPILRRDVDHHGGLHSTVLIGDKEVEYNDGFRLFLLTRNPYPVLPPDAAALVATTNFSVTRSGLVSQLLGLTIQREQPELEQQKSQLLAEEEALKVQLAQVEKFLLKTLADSTGNILENTQLIETLQETKEKSATIAAALRKSKELQASLDGQRDAYRPIAERGASAYFLLKDLRTLNHMYQFSLALFLRHFNQALANAPACESVDARIAALGAELVTILFGYVSRSVFKADRLTFGMHVARVLSPHLFGANAWEAFLGLVAADAAGGGPQRPAWLREEQAGAFAALAAAQPGLVHGLNLADTATWVRWATLPDPEAHFPPGTNANPFQQLLFVQAARPDRLESAMGRFICEALGVPSVAPPTSSLDVIYREESSHAEPVLFITTPGADPSQELEEFAERTVGTARYFQLAMGQGQAEVAEALLRDCAERGDWLCLKNCHLVVAWLPLLEKKIYALGEKVSPEFRLFLTSEPHPKFPASLLEGCLKVTYEAPPGLKANLLRTFDAWPEEYLQGGGPARAQLLFMLAWFHAVVQERRTFVPQGWTKFYEFSFADLRSGADIVDLGMKGGALPQWVYLRGLLESAIYGGRVDSAYDIAVLRAYLATYFCDAAVSADGRRASAVPLAPHLAVPAGASAADLRRLVASLEPADAAALFGLPANIQRTVQEVNSRQVVANLKAIATRATAAEGFDRERWALQLGPLLRLWERLVGPVKFALGQLDASAAARFRSSPLDTFVAMERAHGRSLVQAVARSLGGLARVLAGQEMLTPETQAAGLALLANACPPSWEDLWDGPADPAAFLRAVASRVAAIEQLWTLVQKGTLMQAQLDLAAFFHPSTALNAIRQQTARQLQTSIDSLHLVSCWDGSRLPKGVTVGGLLIQGAAFDGSTLSDVQPDAPSVSHIPPVRLEWVPKVDPSGNPLPDASGAAMPYPAWMPVPVYNSQERDKLVAELQLPLRDPAEQTKWTLAGVALILAS